MQNQQQFAFNQLPQSNAVGFDFPPKNSFVNRSEEDAVALPLAHRNVPHRLVTQHDTVNRLHYSLTLLYSEYLSLVKTIISGKGGRRDAPNMARASLNDIIPHMYFLTPAWFLHISRSNSIDYELVIKTIKSDFKDVDILVERLAKDEFAEKLELDMIVELIGVEKLPMFIEKFIKYNKESLTKTK